MTSVTSCATNGLGLERVRYFPRQLITADDMLAEQQYFRQKQRRHNRLLHGWGVVCGLKALAAPDQAEKGKKVKWPGRVVIEAGYALTPDGNEVYVPAPVCLDLATCLDSVGDPCEPGLPTKAVLPKTGKVYVAVRYVECETRPVRVHPLGCGCEDKLCECSRIRDDSEISCLREMPPRDPIPLLCDEELLPCPPCPESPWVVLAEVTLPEKLDEFVTDYDIDNSVRRQLFSTAILQEQLIECCCGDEEPEKPKPQEPPKIPVRVEEVVPENGATFEDYEPPEEITLIFNKELIPDTVNISSLQLFRQIEGEKEAPVDGTVNPVQQNHSKWVFKPKDRLLYGRYTIIARRSGPDHIVDVDNLALDGDIVGSPGVGTEGGDYISAFEITETPG